MILESAIIAAGLTFLSFYNRDINRLESTWDAALSKCKVEGIRNIDKNTFKLYKTQRTKYGFKSITYIPEGLSIVALEKAITVLQDNLNCLIFTEKSKFKDTISIKFITRDVINNEYEPVKATSDNLFIGYNIDGSPYLLDINKNPHLLIGGATGTGKTFLLSMLLANLIYNSADEIEVYLSQIMKGEIGLFRNCKPVKFVGNTIEEVLIMLRKISKIVIGRSEEFTRSGIKDINQWNKYNPNKKKKRIFLVVEELSFFMPDGSDDEVDKIKQLCWIIILMIAKAGRSVGCHFLSVTQRSTATNLPADVKSQLSRITFKQKSGIDSTNIINTTDAVNLDSREYILDGDMYVRLKSPKIDEDFRILNRYVKEIMIPKKNQKKEEKFKDYNLTKLTYEETQKLKCIPSDNKLNESKDDEKIMDIRGEKAIAKKSKSKRRNGVVRLEEVSIDDYRER